MSNPLPKYYRLLREAQEARETVDNFDLHSDSAPSKARFDELQRASRDAQLELFNFIKNSGETLRRAIVQSAP